MGGDHHAFRFQQAVRGAQSILRPSIHSVQHLGIGIEADALVRQQPHQTVGEFERMEICLISETHGAVDGKRQLRFPYHVGRQTEPQGCLRLLFHPRAFLPFRHIGA